MKNKQPFYHRLELLFTLTTEDHEPLLNKIKAAVEKHKAYVPRTFDVDSHSVEAGDPADLA